MPIPAKFSVWNCLSQIALTIITMRIHHTFCFCSSRATFVQSEHKIKKVSMVSVLNNCMSTNWDPFCSLYLNVFCANASVGNCSKEREGTIERNASLSWITCLVLALKTANAACFKMAFSMLDVLLILFFALRLKANKHKMDTNASTIPVARSMQKKCELAKNVFVAILLAHYQIFYVHFFTFA